ncbi:hypothetical protein LZ30DRAFT_684621 [Colletotrichum cereale]|nr:hypothetical protein LZ30DRAFT_684621 [Colletotrichum cereale]
MPWPVHKLKDCVTMHIDPLTRPDAAPKITHSFGRVQVSSGTHGWKCDWKDYCQPPSQGMGFPSLACSCTVIEEIVDGWSMVSTNCCSLLEDQKDGTLSYSPYVESVAGSHQFITSRTVLKSVVQAVLHHQQPKAAGLVVPSSCSREPVDLRLDSKGTLEFKILGRKTHSLSLRKRVVISLALSVLGIGPLTFPRGSALALRALCWEFETQQGVKLLLKVRSE